MTSTDTPNTPPTPEKAPRKRAPRKAVAPKAPEVPEVPAVVTDEEIASMDRAARIVAANPEKQALAEWRANGQQGPRPVTPILDWFADPNSKPAPKARKAGTSSPRSVVDENLAPKVQAFVESRRAAGESWQQIADAYAAAMVEDGSPFAGVPLSIHQLYNMAKSANWAWQAPSA